jgi:excisionase family DNA binding protein
MLTERDVALTTEVVKDLRARGDQEHAAAVQNVLAAASSTLALAQNSPDVLTVSEAARALGVRAVTVKAWVASGSLPGVQKGSRTVLSRHALLDYLNRMREAKQGAAVGPSTDPGRAASERAFVLEGVPSGVQDRLRTLMEKAEDGVELTAEEEAELDRLEEEVARISAKRLRLWTRQRKQVARNR